jgi:AcrR family transcriptional regulator
MARPVTIKNETIVAAAREVFLARGIQATTSEVAERAGVSEGSVFKRFKTKTELFRAAMGDEPTLPEFIVALPRRVGTGELRERLFTLGMEMVGFFRELIPLMMMAWSNPAPTGLPAMVSGPNPAPVRVVKQLAGYFEAEMRGGRLRASDPEIAARTFVGALHHFAFFELLHRTDGELPLAAETFVRGVVELLLRGSPAPSRSEPRRLPSRSARSTDVPRKPMSSASRR